MCVCDALVQAVTEEGGGRAQEHASSRYDESIRRSDDGAKQRLTVFPSLFVFSIAPC